MPVARGGTVAKQKYAVFHRRPHIGWADGAAFHVEAESELAAHDAVRRQVVKELKQLLRQEIRSLESRKGKLLWDTST